jgi:AraC-like DNA-binding protein
MPISSASRQLHGSLETLIGAGLNGGNVSVDKLAAKLGLSKRTLQRRLQDYGVSYQSLLVETRKQLAHKYLGKPDMAIARSLTCSASLKAAHCIAHSSVGPEQRQWNSAGTRVVMQIVKAIGKGLTREQQVTLLH